MLINIPPKSIFYMKMNPSSSYNRPEYTMITNRLPHRLNSTQITTPPLQFLPKLQTPPKPKSHSTPPETLIKSKKKKFCNNCYDPEATVPDILRLMDVLQLPITEDVYAYLIKECTDLRDAVNGAQVHSHMIQRGYLPTLLLANRLLLMYVSCGCLSSAHQLFDEMIVKDSVSWMIVIAGHFDIGEYVEVLSLFKEMQEEVGCGLLEVSIWGSIVDCVLQACICTGDLGLGMQVHGLVLKTKNKKVCKKGDSCSDELLLGSLFINFYGKLGCVRSARCVFDQMKVRDTVVWTSMIVVYSKTENYNQALEVFKEMARVGMKMNNFTLSSVIRVCGRMGNEFIGRQVHGYAIKLGFEWDQFVQCSLVDMYGKCGLIEESRIAFEMTRDFGYKRSRNEVCWNAMLTSYAQNGLYNEAIKLLYQMQSAGLEPPESLLNQVRTDCCN